MRAGRRANTPGAKQILNAQRNSLQSAVGAVFVFFIGGFGLFQSFFRRFQHIGVQFAAAFHFVEIFFRQLNGAELLFFQAFQRFRYRQFR